MASVSATNIALTVNAVGGVGSVYYVCVAAALSGSPFVAAGTATLAVVNGQSVQPLGLMTPVSVATPLTLSGVGFQNSDVVQLVAVNSAGTATCLNSQGGVVIGTTNGGTSSGGTVLTVLLSSSISSTSILGVHHVWWSRVVLSAEFEW